MNHIKSIFDHGMEQWGAAGVKVDFMNSDSHPSHELVPKYWAEVQKDFGIGGF